MIKLLFHCNLYSKNYITKLLIVMKLTTFLLFLATLQISAGVYSQNAKLNLSFKYGTLADVIDAIENQSDYKIFYKTDQVDVHQQVSITQSDRTISSVLTNALQGSDITYHVMDKLIVLTSAKAEAQQNIITGKVIDSDGQPMPGVNVIVEGTTIGVTSDMNGNYKIEVPSADATFIFSFIGYVTERVQISGRKEIDVTMLPDVRKLDEIVVVGYGTQKKATVTGSVSAVNGAELIKSPVTNVTNSLAGRLPGLVAINKSGEPGSDGSTLRIRGVNTLNNNDPLIVVDGVAGRGLERINSADIESITVLKDASAAIYGAQAANGVILVTTKRGQTGKPTVTLNYTRGAGSPTRIPKMADAATYATMMNEVNSYAGKTPAYSDVEIQKFADGSDPLHYPNTNWFKEVFKSSAPQSNANISLNGGSENLKYFLSLGTRSQDGIYKNSATNYTQYNFRSNIDGKISKDITINFDLSGRQENHNYPTRSAGEIFRFLMRGKPTMIASWPNGKPGPDIEYGDNPVVVATDATGYDRDKWYVLESNLKVNINIPWVKGLSVSVNAAFDKNFENHKVWKTPWTLYNWDGTSMGADGQPVLAGSSRGYSAPQLQQNFLDRENITGNFLINYDTKIAGKHNIKLMVGAERSTKNEYTSMAFRQYYVSSLIDQISAGAEKDMNTDGNQYYSARLNYFGRVNYNYDEKYMVEFVFREDGSYIFNGGPTQFGFFPGVSLGWRVSEENFWKNNITFLNNFKLRASWGQTGNDRIDEYQFLTAYSYGDGRYTGNDAAGRPGHQGDGYTYVFNENVENKTLYEKQIGNPNVTWEIANQSNIGFEASALNNKLTIEGDYFYNKRSQILIYRNGSVAATSGLTLPRENLGKVSNQGVEGTVAYHDKAGQLTYGISVNGGYAKNKVVFWDETPGRPSYQQITGHPIPNDVNNPDGNLYYIAKGIFHTQADVDAANAKWNKDVRTGDIIFDDVNGDGKIDALDRVRNYKTNTPTFTGGFSFNLGYKNFDFSALFQGASGGVRYISTESGEIGNYLQDFAENRWTSANPNASGPRAFNRSNEYWINNQNTYFLKKTDYLRLKNIELGFNTPARFNKILKIQGFRIYVNGVNLWTIDKLKIFDPESDSNSGQIYPLTKVINGGVTLTF
jgi:TonB-dependent starch-binding outer membrane protein SusC